MGGVGEGDGVAEGWAGLASGAGWAKRARGGRGAGGRERGKGEEEIA